MSLPKEVWTLIEQAEAENPASAQGAIQAAIAAVKSMPDYDQFVDAIVENSITRGIYDVRNRRSAQMRRSEDDHEPPESNPVASSEPRVQPGKYAAELNDVYMKSAFGYRIGGTVLGKLTGSDIRRLKPIEAAAANTHTMNFELLDWLDSHGVKDKESVDEVLDGKKLQRKFDQLTKRKTARKMLDAA